MLLRPLQCVIRLDNQARHQAPIIKIERGWLSQQPLRPLGCTVSLLLMCIAAVHVGKVPFFPRRRNVRFPPKCDIREAADFDPFLPLAEGVSLSGMSYRDPDVSLSSGPLRSISWTLVAIGAALLLFICWHQSLMDSDSRRYGIEVPWLSQLLWLLAFSGLELGAIWAAGRKLYGVSIGLSSFVVALLGIAALFAVAQIGV